MMQRACKPHHTGLAKRWTRHRARETDRHKARVWAAGDAAEAATQAGVIEERLVDDLRPSRMGELRQRQEEANAALH